MGLKDVLNRTCPEARTREHDLVSDHPGTKSSGYGRTAAVHGTNPRKSAKLEIAEKFAKSIAEILAQATSEQRMDALIICAEPRFLGLLLPKLSKRVHGKLIGTLNENLLHRPRAEIFKKVRSLMSDQVRVPPAA